MRHQLVRLIHDEHALYVEFDAMFLLTIPHIERLEGMIQELNSRIRELNEPEIPPQISRDMIFKIKKKSHHEQSQFYAYSALHDGVHPGKLISELWLIRINNFINTLNKKM